ncbi:MAG: PHP domain-containing protein [Anaerolineae bacterium]|nr:PHP domain-containing protein [Anaerolineae bacterium]
MTAELRVEFHCHTIYSKDSLTTVENLLGSCQERGIDRVVVTDHNTTAGARRAKQLDPERVIVGEEIMTEQGELLAAFVQQEIPAGLPAMQAVSRLREQGAFISVSHPFDRLRSGHWAQADLLQIAPWVDAIEIFNARCFPPVYNRQAGAFAGRHRLPGTVGSDAHAAFELGRAVMLLPLFDDAESLRIAMKQVKYDVRSSGPWVRLVSRYAVLYKALRRQSSYRP